MYAKHIICSWTYHTLRPDHNVVGRADSCRPVPVAKVSCEASKQGAALVRIILALDVDVHAVVVPHGARKTLLPAGLEFDAGVVVDQLGGLGDELEGN